MKKRANISRDVKTKLWMHETQKQIT